MKKMVGLFIAVAMILSSMAMPLSGYAWTAGDDVDLRVGILGDSHVPNADAFSWFKKAVKDFLEIGQDKLDGFALTGDVVYLTNGVVDDGYDAIYSVFNGTDSEFEGTGIENLPIAYAMGNHEYPLHSTDETVTQQSREKFVEKTGKESSNHTVVMGEDEYTFIAAAADNYNGNVSSQTEQFVMTEIDKALAKDSTNDTDGVFAEGVIPNSVKPVFVQLHHPIDGTIFNMDTDNYSDDFVSFLKTRPQVIVLTGHMHVASQIPTTIWQDGFTTYQTSHLAGGYLTEWECQETENIADVHQSSMIEVTDNVVKIYKLDVVKGEYIGEPWVIDIPAIVSDRTDSDISNDNDNYLYSADKRENACAPEFPSGSEISVDIEQNSVNITWPNSAVATEETPNQQDAFVRGYKVEICDSNGTVLSSKQYQADFYSDTKKETYSCSFGLQYNSTYSAKVYPMGGLGNFGNPIEKTFTTEVESIPENALRYEFEDYIGTYTGTANVIKTENSMASGGYLAGSSWIDSADWTNPEISFNVTVETAGYYDISYAIGQQPSVSVSPIKVFFNGTQIGQNDDSYTYDISNLGTYPWQYTPMMLYKTNMYLEEGTYPVSIKVDPAPNTSIYKFYADYFQVAPEPDPELSSYSTTRIELEKYAVNPYHVQNTDGASGDKVAGNSWAGEDPKMTIPVTVKKSGLYDVSYAVGYLDKDTFGSALSEVTFKIGDTTIGANDKSFVEKLSYNYWATAPMSRYEKENIWLDAGKYSLTMDVSACGSGGVWKYQADYIEFTPKSAQISSTSATTIEFEDYVRPELESCVAEDVTAGGKIVTSSWTPVNPWIKIPVNVSKSGLYDIEYVMGAKPSGSDFCKTTITIDDAVAGTNELVGTDLSANYSSAYSLMPMTKYNVKNVYLEQGESVLSLNTAIRYNSHYIFNFDYIKLVPKAAAGISSSETTVLEFEDYARKELRDYYLVPDENASGDEILSSSWAGLDPAIAVDFPINVPKSGYYNFEYVVGANTVDINCAFAISVGTKIIGDNKGVGTDVSADYTAAYSGMPMTKYNVDNIWLDKGENIIKTSFAVRQPYNSHYIFNMDYISLTPAAPAEISASGTTTIEFEDYATSDIYPEQNASGKEIVCSEWSYDDPSIKIPVRVTQEGYYDISYILGDVSHHTNQLSKIEVYVDDILIGRNDNNSYAESLKDKYTVWYSDEPLNYSHMSLYKNSKVKLTAGEHMIYVKVSAINSVYKYQMDCISLEPSESFINIDGENAEAFASYNSPVTGTAIIALYNGERLVSVNTIDVENKNLVTVTHSEKNTFNKVKMFMWEGLTTGKPLEGTVE